MSAPARLLAWALCGCLLLGGCGARSEPGGRSSASPSSPSSGALERSAPEAPAPAEGPALSAAGCVPVSVPEGWRVFVVRIDGYPEGGGEPYAAGGVALAVPPDWEAMGEPGENGMYRSDDLLDAQGHKLFGVYSMGRAEGTAAFPEAEPLRYGVPDTPMVPREDLTLDGRRAARYPMERTFMDGGPEETEVEITLYRIVSGDYVVGMNAYPRLDRLEEDRALIERILSTAAVIMDPAKT